MATEKFRAVIRIQPWSENATSVLCPPSADAVSYILLDKG